MGRIVGSASPNVVQPGTAVEVTFLVPATDAGGMVDLREPASRHRHGRSDRVDRLSAVGSSQINEEGNSGWMGES